MSPAASSSPRAIACPSSTSTPALPPRAPNPPGPNHSPYASHGELPFVAIIADATGSPKASNPKSLTWPNVAKLTSKLQLPVLTVDGEDAVAVYRCMQESALRARMGAGSALIWAVLTPASQAASLTRSQLPQSRLESYLKTRSIPFKS